MFNKLISNLPFNPSLLNQVAFYARRLKQEAFIRRLGFGFMALAMAIQVFAVVAPPKPSYARSANDIIYNGIGNSNARETWLWNYTGNVDGLQHNDIKAIFDSFNIKPSEVPSNITTINSSDQTLYSLGRNHSNKPTLDEPWPVVIDGQTHTYFLRPLSVWGDNVSYKVLQGSRANPPAGQLPYFAIMTDCGNIVVKKGTTPVPKLSQPVKTALTTNNLPAANTKVTRGQTIGYRVLFSNNGTGVAHSIGLIDKIPTYTTYSWHGGGGAAGGGQHSGSQVSWQWVQMPGGAQNWYIDLLVTVNSNAPDGQAICNTARLFSNESPSQESKPICHYVTVPKTPTPTRTPTPTPPPTTPIIGSGPIIVTLPPPTITTPIPVPVTPVPVPGQPYISNSKLVANLTQGVSDFNNKTASPGDILQYQVLTINTGTVTAPDWPNIKDNVNDVLEYANITEISDSGTLKDGWISWKPADIKANETLTRTFKIQVKSPIPATPRSSSNPQSFDLQIDNTYGNITSFKVPAPTIIKTAEVVTTTTIPNTGPGTTLVVGFSLTVIIGYFFARSRLLATEVEFITIEQTIGGV